MTDAVFRGMGRVGLMTSTMMATECLSRRDQSLPMRLWCGAPFVGWKGHRWGGRVPKEEEWMTFEVSEERDHYGEGSGD